MTPLLLALGIYCHLTMVFLVAIEKKDTSISIDRANFLDNAFFLHLAGLIYFWVKVSDIWFGWSA